MLGGQETKQRDANETGSVVTPGKGRKEPETVASPVRVRLNFDLVCTAERRAIFAIGVQHTETVEAYAHSEHSRATDAGIHPLKE